MKPDYSCGVIPIRYAPEREYLILRHVEGHWDFPKGHPEGDEARRETAARELSEETGLKVVQWLDLPLQTIAYQGTFDGQPVAKTVELFPALVEGKIKLEAGSDTAAEWLPFSEALTRLTYENSQGALRAIESSL